MLRNWRFGCGVGAMAVAGCLAMSVGSNAAPAPKAKVVEETTIRLISDEQYANAIEYVFGADLRPSIKFPVVRRRTLGLAALGSATAEMTPSALEAFEASAREIALKVVDEDHRPYLIGCVPASATAPDDRCASEVLKKYGHVLFRRSLTPGEIKDQLQIVKDATEKSGSFYFGLSTGLANLLMSPEFIFFIERVEPDPSKKGMYRLTSDSVANRLSLFLSNAPPDEELIDAAAKGDLRKPAGLARQVDRLVASPRFNEAMRTFFADMFVFEDFGNLSKDAVIYPAYNAKVVKDAQEQTLRTVTNELLVRRGDYRDIFTTRNTFITRALGQIYGVPVAQPTEWVPYEDPVSSTRAGILGQVSFLSLHSPPGRSSPTVRGKAIREILLCQPVPPPPGNVDASKLEDTSHAKTVRERLELHRQNPVCAGCHKITDPIGLALENFDGAGQHRVAEFGAPIDASGEFDGKKFQNAAELGQILHDSPAVPGCLVDRLVAYGLGREPNAGDALWIGDVKAKFAANKYNVPSLVKAIAVHGEFYAASSEQKNGDSR